MHSSASSPTESTAPPTRPLRPPTPAGSAAIGTPGSRSPNDTGILVRLTKDPIGPPYLIIGPELAAATSNITRAEMNLRLVDQNLGGFGSELRGTAELGYKTDALRRVLPAAHAERIFH